MTFNKNLLLSLALAAAGCAQLAHGMMIPSKMKAIIDQMPETPVEKKIERNVKPIKYNIGHNIKQEWEDGTYKTTEFELPQTMCPYCDETIDNLLTINVCYDTTGDYILVSGVPFHEEDLGNRCKEITAGTEYVIFAHHLKNGTTIAQKPSTATITQDPRYSLEHFPENIYTYMLKYDNNGIYSVDHKRTDEIQSSTRKIAIDGMSWDNLKQYGIKAPISRAMFTHSCTKDLKQDNAIMATKLVDQDDNIILTIFGVNPCKPLCTLSKIPPNTNPINMCDQDNMRRKIFVNDDGTEIYYFDSMTLRFKVFKLLDKTPGIGVMPNKDTFFKFK